MSNVTLEPVPGTEAQANLVEEAQRLVPLLRAEAASVEEAGRLTPAVHQAFLDAGFYRMTMPPSLSRSEGTLPEAMRVLETLATGDTSSAWSVWAGLGVPAISAFMDEAGVYEVFGPPDATACGSVAGVGRAIAVEGGYRVTGRWPFVSGIRQATCSGGICMVYDAEEQRLTPDGEPVVIFPIWPIADCTVLENWDTTGLRGTGSHDMAVEDLFVPAVRIAEISRPPREGLAALNYLHMDNAANVTVAAIALGTAESAIDAFRRLALTKKLPDGSRLADSALARIALGRAELRLTQARGHLYETADMLWEAAIEGRYQHEDWFARTAMASVAAVDAAIDVAVSLYREAGTSAVRTGVLDRAVRDLLTLGAHKTVQHVNLLKYAGASLQRRASEGGEPR